MRIRNTYKGSKLYMYIIILLTALCALLLGLDILVFRFSAEEEQYRNSGYFVKNLEEFLFFCEDLSLSQDEDANTFDVKRNLYKYFLHKNKYVCSFRNLTEPLRKFVERKSRLRLALGLDEKQYLQCGNESLKKASGHLSVAFRKVSPHQSIEGEESDLVLHWDKHTKVSSLSEELEYHKGQIKVPDGRFYFVYSSILINLTDTVFQTGKAFRFLLQICVNSRGHERTIFYKSQVYNTNGMDSISSLSVGGHAFLAKDDSVYVRVSEVGRIIRDSLGNSFGIMPLR